MYVLCVSYAITTKPVGGMYVPRHVTHAVDVDRTVARTGPHEGGAGISSGSVHGSGSCSCVL